MRLQEDRGQIDSRTRDKRIQRLCNSITVHLCITVNDGSTELSVTYPSKKCISSVLKMKFGFALVLLRGNIFRCNCSIIS